MAPTWILGLQTAVYIITLTVYTLQIRKCIYEATSTKGRNDWDHVCNWIWNEFISQYENSSKEPQGFPNFDIKEWLARYEKTWKPWKTVPTLEQLTPAMKTRGYWPQWIPAAEWIWQRHQEESFDNLNNAQSACKGAVEHTPTVKQLRRVLRAMGYDLGFFE